MSSVEVLRKRNWKCNDCGEFCWGVARPATKKEISKASEFVEWADENMEVYEYPKNEDEWRVAVLYCGENIYEMSDEIDFIRLVDYFAIENDSYSFKIDWERVKK